MKQKFIIIAILYLFTATYAIAQVRVDVNLSVPIYGSIFTGSTGTGQHVEYFTIVPDIMLHYVLGTNVIKIGFGGRMVTGIVENIIFPNAFLEIDSDLIVFNLSFGGPFVFAYGLESNSYFWILPDISMYFKLNEQLQLGGGVSRSNIQLFEYTLNYSYYYARVRFVFNL